PDELTIPANTDVTITLTNKGALNHDFSMDVPTAFTSDPVSGGQSTTFTLNLPPGTYDFYCSQPGHKAAGMVGKLTVVDGGTAGETTTSPTPSATGTASSPAGTPFSVSTVDLAFAPKTLTIPANTNVTITITNKGVLQHDFTIDAAKVQSKLLNGGDSDTVTVNLPAGTYEYYCSVPGHKEAGMVGTLTVQ
ncbi:MAG TPA: cupredoxin domain-containing protein, partial [Thermomicrobiales bacterium]|nr:cupredoxin domain-containing protein [Thermomicrobiales bacterium]